MEKLSSGRCCSNPEIIKKRGAFLIFSQGRNNLFGGDTLPSVIRPRVASGALAVCFSFFVFPPDVLVHVHGGIGSAQEAVFGRTVLWVESKTDTG
jgi:hypothetical protein